MLEEKITKIKLLAGFLGAMALGGAGCVPGISVPVRYVTVEGIRSNNLSCCSLLNCEGYDGCRVDGEAFRDGIFYDVCSCYREPTSSSSTSSREPVDRQVDRTDRVGRDGHWEGPSGHWEKPDCHK